MNSRDDAALDLRGLPASRMKALLGLALSREGERSALPAHAARALELRERLDRLIGARAAGGSLLLDRTCSSSTPLDELKRIKNRGKSAYSRSESAEDRAAAMILYHAAIAGAYAFHRERISTRLTAALGGLYEDLALALGDDRLGDVFRLAVRRAETDSTG